MIQWGYNTGGHTANADDNMAREAKLCPLCGKAYTENPMLWALDRHVFICPRCGKQESERFAASGRAPRKAALREAAQMMSRA